MVIIQRGATVSLINKCLPTFLPSVLMGIVTHTHPQGQVNLMNELTFQMTVESRP